jgi:hypothetical protein
MKAIGVTYLERHLPQRIPRVNIFVLWQRPLLDLLHIYPDLYIGDTYSHYSDDDKESLMDS